MAPKSHGCAKEPVLTLKAEEAELRAEKEIRVKDHVLAEIQVPVAGVMKERHADARMAIVRAQTAQPAAVHLAKEEKMAQDLVKKEVLVRHLE
jgi:phage antirepressor YoqD-like protein